MLRLIISYSSNERCVNTATDYQLYLQNLLDAKNVQIITFDKLSDYVMEMAGQAVELHILSPYLLLNLHLVEKPNQDAIELCKVYCEVINSTYLSSENMTILIFDKFFHSEYDNYVKSSEFYFNLVKANVAANDLSLKFQISELESYISNSAELTYSCLKLEDVTNFLDRGRKNYIELNSRKGFLEGEIENDLLRIKNLSEVVEEAKSALNDKDEELKIEKAKTLDLNEKLNFENQRCINLNSEIELIKGSNHSLQEELLNNKQELHLKSETLYQLQSEYVDIRRKLNAASSTNESLEKRNKEEVTKYQKELELANDEISALVDKNRELNHEYSQIKSKHNSVTEKLKIVESKNKSLNSSVQNHEKYKTSVTKKLELEIDRARLFKSYYKKATDILDNKKSLMSIAPNRVAKQLKPLNEKLKICVKIIDSGLFDVIWYKEKYKIKESDISFVEHYIDHATKNNQNPSSEFSNESYYKLNPDVKSAGFDGLVHYVLYGKDEQRSIK